MNIKHVSDLLLNLLNLMSPSEAKRLFEGVREAIETGGDVSRIYHRVSLLEHDYYAGNLKVKGYHGYYKEYRGAKLFNLPPPKRKSGKDVLEALRNRRSRRSYSEKPLTLEDLSTILYYTLGVTGRAWWGGPKRAYPSAGALQPVEGYIEAKNIAELPSGLYHYNPGRHALELLREGDYSRELGSIALDQDHVAQAPAVLILTTVYTRTASKYGHRSYRYVHWDVGFAGENVYIVAEALNLATVAVGAFYDLDLCRFLNIDCVTEIPMLLFPLGYRTKWD
ncbi:MAG: SagB/ThcOx family dehydrogenase [Desulfurococcales archaeon]|nr:SagB/ThcOx family dehydrogenase [Desulfurococcales archaeon]